MSVCSSLPRRRGRPEFPTPRQPRTWWKENLEKFDSTWDLIGCQKNTVRLYKPGKSARVIVKYMDLIYSGKFRFFKKLFPFL
jgi:hypothetical protein